MMISKRPLPSFLEVQFNTNLSKDEQSYKFETQLKQEHSVVRRISP